MGQNADDLRQLELTPENWKLEFGENGVVTTPIGEVKMGENQLSKLFFNGRNAQFGLIKPTLENPQIIVEIPSTSAYGASERESSLLFIKTFKGKDGKKFYYFKSVTVKKDGLEVSISSHFDRQKRVLDALKKGKLLYRFDGGAQTEQNPASASVTVSPQALQGSEPGKEVAASQQYDPIPADKDNASSDNKQELGQKSYILVKTGDFVAFEQDGAIMQGKVTDTHPDDKAEVMYVDADGEPRTVTLSTDALRVDNASAKPKTKAKPSQEAESNAPKAEDKKGEETTSSDTTRAIPDANNGGMGVATGEVHGKDTNSRPTAQAEPAFTKKLRLEEDKKVLFSLIETEIKDYQERVKIVGADDAGEVPPFMKYWESGHQDEILEFFSTMTNNILSVSERGKLMAEAMREFIVKANSHLEAIDVVDELLTNLMGLPINPGVVMPLYDAATAIWKNSHRRLAKEQISELLNTMGILATKARNIELNDEMWLAEFGPEGQVTTPLGVVKLGDSQRQKLVDLSRESYFGMIKPTLENPDIILEKASPEKGAERQTKYLFIKTFVKSDGSRVVHFESVTVSCDGIEVDISNHEINKKDVIKEMQNDNILHLRKELTQGSEGSFTPAVAKTGPDLVPTSANSEDKDTNGAADVQADKSSAPESAGSADVEASRQADEAIDAYNEQLAEYFRLDEPSEAQMRGIEILGARLRRQLAEYYESTGMRPDEAGRAAADLVRKNDDDVWSHTALADRIAREADEVSAKSLKGVGATAPAGKGQTSGLDSQGNKVDAQGRLVAEPVARVSDISDADFMAPTRSIQLPPLAQSVADVIGTQGKPAVIKKNILKKNRDAHRDLTPEQSREILGLVLYSPDLYGQNQKAPRPYNWILIHLDGDARAKHSAVVMEVSSGKDNVEIVNWHFLGKTQLQQKKNQAVKEGGLILALSGDKAAGNASELGSEGKDTKKGEKSDNERQKFIKAEVERLRQEHEKDVADRRREISDKAEQERVKARDEAKKERDAIPYKDKRHRIDEWLNDQLEEIDRGEKRELEGINRLEREKEALFRFWWHNIAENVWGLRHPEPRQKGVCDPMAALSTSPSEKVKALDIVEIAAATDDLRPSLKGVHYEEGLEVVTDGCIMVMRRADYDPALEGKTLMLDGSVKSSRYSDCLKVVPGRGTPSLGEGGARSITYGVSALTKFLKQAGCKEPSRKDNGQIKFAGALTRLVVSVPLPSGERICLMFGPAQGLAKVIGAAENVEVFCKEPNQPFAVHGDGIVGLAMATNGPGDAIVSTERGLVYCGDMWNAASLSEGASEARAQAEKMAENRLKEFDKAAVEASEYFGNAVKGKEGTEIGGIYSQLASLLDTYSKSSNPEQWNKAMVKVSKWSAARLKAEGYDINKMERMRLSDNAKLLYRLAVNGQPDKMEKNKRQYVAELEALARLPHAEYNMRTRQLTVEGTVLDPYSTAPVLGAQKGGDDGQVEKAGEPRNDAPEGAALSVSRAARLSQSLVENALGRDSVKVVSDEQCRKALEEATAGTAGNGVRFMKAQKRATETATWQEDDIQANKATDVSDADGAKVLNNLDILCHQYETKSNRPRTINSDIASAMRMRTKGTSSYGTFRCVNGDIITIRISNHNASSRNSDSASHPEEISIVISNRPNKGITNDGIAHIVEFFYRNDQLSKAEGKPLVEILKSLKQSLYSGEYKDTTGLAQRQEVNAVSDGSQFHLVWHGSGNDFAAFDHSHMGEGEGQQAYGWGTYVTGIKGVAQTYATSARKLRVTLDGKEIYFGNSDVLTPAERAAVDDMRHSYNGSIEGAIEWAMNYLDGYDRIIQEEKDKGNSEKVHRELAPYIQNERQAIEILKSGRISVVNSGRHLYRVDIPDDNGHNYIQWTEKVDAEEIGRIKEAMLQKVTDPEKCAEIERVMRPHDKFDGEWLVNQVMPSYMSPKEASMLLSDLGYVGIKYPAEYRSGGDGSKGWNYVIFNEGDAKIVEHTQFMRNERGEVYGYTRDGKIYLNEKYLNADTPIHEYTHLWDAMCRRRNPDLWQRGVELMRQLPLWQETAEKYADLAGDTDDIATEVHARLTGKDGERLLKEMAGGKGDLVEGARATTLIGRVRQWLADMYRELRDTLGRWSGRDLSDLTSEQFRDLTLRDLAQGMGPRKLGEQGRQLDTWARNIHSTQAADIEFIEKEQRQNLNDRASALPEGAALSMAKGGEADPEMVGDGKLTEEETETILGEMADNVKDNATRPARLTPRDLVGEASEQATRVLVELSQRYRDDRAKRLAALKAINRQTAAITQAVTVQRGYDRATVRTLTDTVKLLLGSGLIDTPTRRDINSLLTWARDNTGRQNGIERACDRLLQIIGDNQRRAAVADYRKSLKVKGYKVNTSGIKVQGKLDADGQTFLEEYKKQMKDRPDAEREASLRQSIEAARATGNQKRMADADAMERALDMALDHKRRLTDMQHGLDDMKEELKNCEAEIRVNLGGDTDVLHSLREQRRELRRAIASQSLQIADAYRAMAVDVRGELEPRSKAAQKRVDEARAHKNEILHEADRDTAGRQAPIQQKERRWRKWNNPLIREGLFAPLGSFEQLMKCVNRNAINGEGYLYDRFVNGWMACQDRMTDGIRQTLQQLDEAVVRISGGHWTHFTDMYSDLRHGKTLDVSFVNSYHWKNGHRVADIETHTLTQANLLYIYMVDKMADGRMKLRRMGITDKDVETISKSLDPNAKAVMDWVQGDFMHCPLPPKIGLTAIGQNH